MLEMKFKERKAKSLWITWLCDNR